MVSSSKAEVLIRKYALTAEALALASGILPVRGRQDCKAVDLFVAELLHANPGALGPD
jgi:hypothetical protein